MIINYGLTQKIKAFAFLASCLLFISACSNSNKEEVDKLNSHSYAYHYRNLDSTIVYARHALAVSDGYDEGRAEAYNNLVFASIARMDYPKAYSMLDSIESITDSQVELLIADIQYMRLCQRQSKNKDFYDFRERAIRRQRRIKEESGMLSEHQRMRMIYAQSEYNIINSIYFYYVGLKSPSIKALDAINPNGEIEADTAQMMNYWYNIGAGGIVTAGTREQIEQTEFDYLIKCCIASIQCNYPYWEAQALQGISEHLQSPRSRKRLIADNQLAIRYINTDNMPDALLAGNLAQRSLDIFSKYGDVYQIAGAYRTLAECYWAIKDYQSALICLNNALQKDTVINRAPDLVASIREQLCLDYSAINQKSNSDYNRNLYLDIQERTRQDRQLEARADQLERSAKQQNIMISAVILMIIIVVVLLFIFDNMRRKSDRKNSLEKFLEPLKEWERNNEEQNAANEEILDDINEKTMMTKMHIIKNKRRNIEQRAKISLVNSITPFIDRIINEVHFLSFKEEKEQTRQDRYTYVSELTNKIIEYNGVLTQWIQMRQGELSLHVESFELQSLFDIVMKGKMGFQLKNINLIVDTTSAIVKADKALTLFMINTMADNARQYTQAGGSVNINAISTDDYVEINIIDNGKGMDETYLSHVFDHKPIIDNKENNTANQNNAHTSHGFGLMNCKGIIDKYRKISKIFNVCSIGAESSLGKGSRFYFRLPKGIMRVILLGILSLGGWQSGAARQNVVVVKTTQTNVALRKAADFADSAYFSNINGTYRRTLAFADSCRHYLNKVYLTHNPEGKNIMVAYSSTAKQPAEITWFHDSLYTNYNVILDIRNESAVAALALHKWSVYKYNNNVYTQLFRESSADNTLTDYVRVMQKSETNKTVAVILLILLLVMVFPAYYFLYYRHRIYFRFCVDKINKINDVLLSEDTPQAKLSKIEKVWNNKKMILNAKLPQLEMVVKQIENALKQSISSNEAQQTTIELSEDEWHRAELENYNLYISNSVLDNCLSTLKHETMYYPSQISQLVNGTDSNLQSICELVSYYKDLYSILSAQAMRQIMTIKQRFKIVNMPSICSIPLLGDEDMLKYLFEILQKENGGNKLDVNVSEKGSRYVIINIDMPTLKLTEEQCRQLFSPMTINVKYMICRQIVRDIGEATNARGCGIQALPKGNGTTIEVVLARAQSHAITK